MIVETLVHKIRKRKLGLCIYRCTDIDATEYACMCFCRYGGIFYWMTTTGLCVLRPPSLAKRHLLSGLGAAAVLFTAPGVVFSESVLGV